MLVTAQFWAFATDTFNLKTGQRVFPLIMVGLSIGALVGPALAGELFKMFGPQVLMLIAVLVLSLTLPLIVWSRDAVPASSRSRYTRPESTRHDLLGGFSLIMKNRYLLLIAALVVLLNWVNSTGEFILADVVVRHADSLVANDPSLKKGDIIAGFYGGFFSIVNALSLLLQIFLVSRIFRWIGVHGAILILPVIALVGYGMMAFVPIFSMIRIVKIMENGTDYSLMNTARQALFLPLSASEKYEAKIAIDAFFWRFGDVIQAGVIYVGLNVLEFQVKQFAMLNMALALVWIGLALQIGRMYVRHKKLVTVDEPPQLVCALEVQVAPPGLPLDFQLPNSLFVSSDPGDVLTISARPVDGGSLPGWLKFDAELLRFQGVPPGDLDGMTWLTIRATNMEGGWSETRLGFNH